MYAAITSDILTYAWFPRNTEDLFGGLCQKSLRVQSVALAESPHANRILGVKTAENYATGFRAYVGSSEVLAASTGHETSVKGED